MDNSSDQKTKVKKPQIASVPGRSSRCAAPTLRYGSGGWYGRKIPFGRDTACPRFVGD